MTLPILYSYRRCPYAMRARMGLHYAGVAYETREIALKQKPKHMVEVSPKATVPVLVLPDGRVLEESLDILNWAISQHDPDDWKMQDAPALQQKAQALIQQNDGPFKHALDRYKYAIRFPEKSQLEYRAMGEVFLTKLEACLNAHPYLCHEKLSKADIAIFPFVRQFVGVDANWFATSPYPNVRAWLDAHVNAPLFEAIMQKFPTWEECTI